MYSLNQAVSFDEVKSEDIETLSELEQSRLAEPLADTLIAAIKQAREAGAASSDLFGALERAWEFVREKTAAGEYEPPF